MVGLVSPTAPRQPKTGSERHGVAPTSNLPELAACDKGSDMRSVLMKLVVLTLALAATVRLMPGLDFEGSFWALVAIALIFGVINAVLRPVVKILALPVIILTLGIGALFVNGLLFWVVVWLAAPERLDLGLTSNGFWPAFFGAIVMGIITWALGTFLDRD